MELTYTKVGDYYIPDLVVSGEKRSIGKYGRLRKRYLQEHRSMVYTDMLLSDKLWHYLADVEEQAQERLEVLIQQMEWVRRMNSIYNRAEEIVKEEIHYS